MQRQTGGMRNKLFNLRTETPHQREETKKPIQVEKLDWKQELHNREDEDLDLEELRRHLDELYRIE